MTDKSIVWLASYPKSGNTWSRAFLINYLFDAEKPIPINQMHRFSTGDSIAAFYEKINRGPLSAIGEQGILQLRPRVLKAIAGNGADINFVKCHNINSVAFGYRLIPKEFTRYAVYIVRNPLDVVLSYARHFGLSIDKTIYAIAQDSNTTLTDEKNVKQFLGSWSRHVESWAQTRDFPVHVMRYEDMQADPEKAFGTLVKKLGLPYDEQRLDRAIRHASFKELKRQEDTYGFVERSAAGTDFFHSGTTDQWKTDLTPEQIARVREDHGKVMRKYGYF